MAVQELGMMDYLRNGSEMGQALAAAMQKRRMDAIAAELGGSYGMPVGGMDELRVKMELEKMMTNRERQKFENQKLQGDIAAQPIENREREARAQYYSESGAREQDKLGARAYQENLDSYNREREKIGKELTDLEADLSNSISEKSDGNMSLDAWKSQQNAWRGDAAGNSKHGLISQYMGGPSPGENGEFAHIKLADGSTARMKWDDYQEVLGKVRTLDTRRKQLEEMKTPEKPSGATTPPAPAGAGIKLSPELAAQFFEAAGRDPVKAREMARQAGF